MKGTPEELIKSLRCQAATATFCSNHNDNQTPCLCPYEQEAYTTLKETLTDAAELLERCQEISDLYLKKCEEVNELKKLLTGKFDPDKFVDIYNGIISEESQRNAEPFSEHENI